MKKIFTGALLICTLSSFCQKAETAFRIPEKDLIPEGITYDPATRSFFVSSIIRRKIVKVDEQRKSSDFVSSGQDGIGEVLGLKIVNGKLWACSNLPDQDPSVSMMHQYDIATGKLVKKWVLPPSKEHHLFNDLAVTKGGDAFITDSDFGAVYHVNSQLDEPELWAKDARLRDSNGIALLTDESVVVAATGFSKIDTKTKEITSLPFGAYFTLGVDGMCLYKQSLVGIQNVSFPVSINQYYLDASLSKVERARVILADHPQFDIPTTGVIVDNWFYFIANSQLLNFEKGHVKDPSKLQEVLIMRAKLD